MYKSYKKEVMAQIEKSKRASLEAVGLVVQAESVKTMSKVGYYDGFGDMVDSGRLRASIDHDVHDNGNSVLIGTNVEYADYVFLGTFRMAGRNAILDSVNLSRDKIKRVVFDVYKRLMG